MVIELGETKNKYDVIYSDPPWKQQKGGKRKCRPTQGRELDYSTLEINEIKRIHAEASLAAKEKHNFFVWTIDKYLHDTEKMMKELGYDLHARIIWDKENGVAPAFTVRFSHEYLLRFYKKGKILMPEKDKRGKYTTVMREKSTKHSKKPLAAYEMLEGMFKGEKLELFARNERKEWDCFGNEVGLNE